MIIVQIAYFTKIMIANLHVNIAAASLVIASPSRKFSRRILGKHCNSYFITNPVIVQSMSLFEVA